MQIGGIYLLAVLLRFLLQIARADFYNPVSQAVVRLTDPMVRIFRSFYSRLPRHRFQQSYSRSRGRSAGNMLMFLMYGRSIPSLDFIITFAVVGVTYFIVNIYYYAIIGSIIMSFVMMFSGNMNPHPILHLIWQLTEPVMGPIRRVIPPMGGLDFSPIFIFIVIGLIQNLLRQTFGISPRIAAYVIGI